MESDAGVLYVDGARKDKYKSPCICYISLDFVATNADMRIKKGQTFKSSIVLYPFRLTSRMNCIVQRRCEQSQPLIFRGRWPR